MSDNRYMIHPASDGDPCGCKVFDPDGKEIKHIETVEWIHQVDELPRIRLTVYGKLTQTLIARACATEEI